MRTRITQDPPGWYEVTMNCHDSYVPAHHNYYPIGFFVNGDSEEIRDDPKRKTVVLPDGSKSPLWKDCYHQRVSASADLSLSKVSYYGAPSYMYCNRSGPGDFLSYFTLGDTRDIGYCLKAMFPPDLTPPTSYYKQWERCKPSMGSRANAFVFLVELRDLKRMFDVIPTKHFGKTWRQVLKEVNNQHLNLEFGWKPFCSDLWAFGRQWLKFTERFQKFLRNQGRALKKRLSESKELEFSGVQTSATDFTYRLRYKTTGKATFVSSFQYVYDVPPYAPWELNTRAWLDALGLNPTLANIWRVIPFSFAVDWFVNIGEGLDTWSEDWLHPWITLCQACFSVDAEWTTSFSIEQVTGQGVFTYPVGSTHHRLYRRTIGKPNYQYGFQELNSDKIRLLASLGLSFII